MTTIAQHLEGTRWAWCETCREAYAPPRDWTDGGGIVMALRVWVIRHNYQRHPRRARRSRFFVRQGHEGRTDCR